MGVPDLEDKDPNFSTYMSKRYRVYLMMIDKFNLDDNRKIMEDPNLSAIILLSNEALKQDPELQSYISVAMDNAIS